MSIMSKRGFLRFHTNAQSIDVMQQALSSQFSMVYLIFSVILLEVPCLVPEGKSGRACLPFCRCCLYDMLACAKYARFFFSANIVYCGIFQV